MANVDSSKAPERGVQRARSFDIFQGNGAGLAGGVYRQHAPKCSEKKKASRSGQANSWVKQKCAMQDADVIKLSDKEYLRTLENGVRSGRPILIENVGERYGSILVIAI